MTPDKKRAIAVEIIAVSKVFDDVLAVNDVSLEIRTGELFALLGGSGCGKTTLLRMLAGFETPSTGDIKINGSSVLGLPPYKRPVNMMFQSYALFPHMTVEQNVAFGLKQSNMPKNDINLRVSEVLDLVQMSSFRRRKPNQLSGGQQQRVALARSLAKKPDLLLLDEPMGALDKKLRMKMQLELANIIEEVGVTCVMVTHDQEEAMTMADRIAIMDEGQIRQVGSPREVYEFPNSKLTAEFIGTINVFPAEAQRIDGHLVFSCPSLGCPVIGPLIATQPEIVLDASYCVAIRPEKIQLAAGHHQLEANCAIGHIDDIAYLGSHNVVHVRLADGKIVQVHASNLSRESSRTIDFEQAVTITWEKSAVILLTEEVT